MPKKATILVTGGAGYIGSHICKMLDQADYLPVVYDNLSTGNRHAAKWGLFEEGDVLDTQHLTDILKKHNVDAIIHMAAFIAVEESVRNPSKYYRNNTFGGLSVLEAAIECSIDKIVFSSTAAVYGNPEELPITEESPTKPINPYGHSKHMMEQILADHAISDNIKSVILRYFNVAGADLETEIGCEHKNPNNLIPILMNVQSGKKDLVEIYGTDYETPDGSAIRDYIHVWDLAQAHILSLDHLFKNGTSTTLNLGTGRGLSVKEVIASVEKTTNKKVPVKHSPRRVGDPQSLFADASKAQKTLDWKAVHSDIDTITKSAWLWQQKLFGKKNF